MISSAGTQSFAEAEKTCAKNVDSRLISVHNADEQTALVDYLFTRHSTVDNVWLGARYSGQVFRWEDGSNLTAFAKWAPKNPKTEKLVDTCVQMHSEREIRGQWSNEPCTRLNRVVCERKQRWTLAKMQELIEKMEKRIEKMADSPVPLGFIYVQLPKEKSPQEIWPSSRMMTWTDVSAQFDSTFFRVAGSRAETFGTVQEEFSPYIDRIKHDGCTGSNTICHAPYEVSPQRSVTGWTGNVIASFSKDGNDYKGYLNFHTAGGEVRPRNMAVRVWKRTG